MNNNHDIEESFNILKSVVIHAFAKQLCLRARLQQDNRVSIGDIIDEAERNAKYYKKGTAWAEREMAQCSIGDTVSGGGGDKNDPFIQNSFISADKNVKA